MTTAQAESTIPTGTWQSDPVHSSVGFSVRHAVGTFRGGFGQFEATLSDALGEPRLTGRVPVDTVQVKEENLEAHLLSPEFFDKDQAPEIGFESSKVTLEDDNLVVEGELTVKGNSRKVVATGDINGPIPGPDGNDRLGIDLATVVDRHDFGLDWNMDMPDGSKMLGDEVTLSVHLELVKEA
ncbi:MAG TPA: YceI family protein [Solirubrobacterales bacterium]|nr:YceI family protein [Solirubrobacterales bacterium]